MTFNIVEFIADDDDAIAHGPSDCPCRQESCRPMTKMCRTCGIDFSRALATRWWSRGCRMSKTDHVHTWVVVEDRQRETRV